MQLKSYKMIVSKLKYIEVQTKLFGKLIMYRRKCCSWHTLMWFKQKIFNKLCLKNNFIRAPCLQNTITNNISPLIEKWHINEIDSNKKNEKMYKGLCDIAKIHINLHFKKVKIGLTLPK